MPQEKDFKLTYMIYDWLRKMQNEGLLKILNDELIDFRVRLYEMPSNYPFDNILVHGVYRQTEYDFWGHAYNVYALHIDCGAIYLSNAVLNDYELFKKLFLGSIKRHPEWFGCLKSH
jgi:hypothetical protein